MKRIGYLPMDNPKSWYHWRYHKIIDRATALVIAVLLSKLCVEVVGASWSAFIPAILVACLYAAVGIVAILVWLAFHIFESLKDYFAGY